MRPGPARTLLAALAVGAALRFGLLLAAREDPQRFLTPDAREYLALARDPVSGYLDPGSPLFATGLKRTPAFPSWVAAVLRLPGAGLPAVIASQVLLGLVVVGLTGALASRLLGPGAGACAALLLAVDPASALYTCVLQPETLFTLLVVALALAWHAALVRDQAPPALAAGVLAGLAALTRPIAVLLPALLVVVGPPLRRSGPRGYWRLAVALLAPFLLLTGTWTLRNRSLTGAVVLSTIEGTNLLDYRAAGALSEETGLPIEAVRERLRARLDGAGPPGNAAERSRRESSLALEVLRERPLGALRSAARGGLRLASGSGLTLLLTLVGDADPEDLSRRGRMLGSLALGLPLALTYAAAALAAADLLRRRACAPLLFLLGFVAYFLVMSAGPEANTRFRVPLMPFVCALAGRGIATLASGGAGDSAPRRSTPSSRPGPSRRAGRDERRTALARQQRLRQLARGDEAHVPGREAEDERLDGLLHPGA